jgi:lipopolysaccharide export system ATP-binding protein
MDEINNMSEDIQEGQQTPMEEQQAPMEEQPVEAEEPQQAEPSADAEKQTEEETKPEPQPEERMVLRTEGLVKRYGKRTVVNDVSIDVKQGEIVGLLGPNGAGKTTSFYMTTGLIVPNAGHIFLNDKDITSYPVYKRARAGIGYLPQEASVFRKMSVEDKYPLRA